MRFRTTLLLLVLAVAIGVAVMKSDRYVPTVLDLWKAEQTPLPFDSAQIDQIDLESAESQISLKVVDRLWRIGKPVDDVADPDRVTALLAALHDAEWLDQLGADELTESVRKMTGLEKPFAHLKLQSAGRVVAECWVGNAAALEGACYLAIPGRNAGERTVLLAKTELPELLKKPVESWRDDHLLRVPAESVSRIALSNGHGQIEMRRDKPKSPWNLVKPLQTRGQNERINELLATILGLKISAVAPTDAKATPPLDALKLTVESPAFGRPLELNLLAPLDAKAGKTTATISHRDHTFTITSDRLASLWAQLNELRDDHLARVDTEKVDGVVVKSDLAGEVALRKEGDHWLLQRHGVWEPANGERVAKVFEALNEHLVKEFVADSAANLEPYGLDKPFLTVAWNETGEKPNVDPTKLKTSGKSFVASPLIQTDTALFFGQDKQGNVFAKYEDEPFIYRVGAAILNALPRDNVRWKALNPVRFSQFALRRITISVGTNPPRVLDYNPVSAVWTGSSAGEDWSSQIDRVKADHLADKLGSLVVEDWAQDRTEGTKALQTPVFTLQVTLLSEPGNLSSALKEQVINFAPTVPGTDTALYYGRLNDGPDVFLITRAALLDLLRDVRKSK